MIRINLLPHREQKRRERRQHFYIGAGLMLLVGALAGVVVHAIIAGYIGAQEGRNNIFKAEIAKLDQQIAEIKRLREQIDALLARKRVIESLQTHRAETVHLLNELAHQVPEGISLKSVKQNGLKITLAGYAQSNARVSTLMRNLDSSPYLEQPQVVEIKAGSFNNRRVQEFTLDVALERPKEDGTSADKGAKAEGTGK